MCEFEGLRANGSLDCSADVFSFILQQNVSYPVRIVGNQTGYTGGDQLPHIILIVARPNIDRAAGFTDISNSLQI
jgi:hypothetical protein